MKKLLLFILIIISTYSFSQTQIGSDINGEALNDWSGSSVSLNSDGTVLAIGAHYNAGNGPFSGHVRVYRNTSGSWVQIGSDIDSEISEDQSGSSVSLSTNGSVVAIGATRNDGNGSSSGHVRVYTSTSGNWIQIGSDIDGEASYDELGSSVSLNSDGSVVAIGAPFNDGNGSSSGHVRIYRSISGSWTQIGTNIEGEAVEDYSGISVSLNSDGSKVAIGAMGNTENGYRSGHVRVYSSTTGSWVQIGSDIDGESTDDQSGTSVSLSSNGSVVAIGARLNDGNGSSSGHVRVYRNTSGNWVQIGIDINGEATGDLFGSSVSLSSNSSVIAIGAIGNDGNGSSSGHVRVYDLSAVLSSNNFTLSQFKIYPNPTKNQFTIQLQEGVQLKKASIYNQLGQFIFSTDISVVNTKNFSQGMYFLEVITNKGKSTKKLIIE